MMPSPETRPTVPRPCTPRNSNRSCAETALSLHADTGHPAGNLVFGRVFDLLAAYTWKRWRTQIDRWGPLGGGVALLAFLGMGGDRTDIFAPFAGFGSGCLFGLVFGVLESRSLLAAWHKHTLGLAAPLYFALAWTLVFLARA